ncbi:MAG: exodeoxyribonuclease V subunit gamma [Deltaproteobacteria bacterium]|nr:exodeoxyribonuclease V subunit gamma [Deltaproteobacteria bacterium]
MLHLVYSSQTEKLLDALIADLHAHREQEGPLAPQHLVVHNRNVETFVRFGIARETGIAANLSVHLLRRFVTELLVGDGPVELLDADALSGHLLGLLLDDSALKGKDLAPVREYLRAAGESNDAMDLRRVQLANRLGRLFEEYGFSREELLRVWPERMLLQKTPLAGAERWQRALWLKLFGSEGVLARRQKDDGIRRVQLGTLLDQPLGKLALPKHVHVFGVSYVARAFQRVFALLAEQTELHVYALNPCREFWEDVRGRRVPEGDDPFNLAVSENAALRLWGKPGRENIRLLNALAECDFVERFPETDSLPDTLLGSLQREILERAPAPPAPRPVARDDESLCVLKAPSVRREAEAVAEEIWSLVERDPDLRFNEIAVIVAGRDRETYFAQLTAAFRACHDLPHNVVDLELARTSSLAEAVQLLLALPLGGFTRPELLDLLTHPSARARDPNIDADAWVAWCERLEILRGADQSDHAGTYVDGDHYNWDQGLRRLALGAFLTGERSGDRRALELDGARYLPEELGRDLQGPAAQLAMAVRALIADARFARKQELTLPEWAAFLSAQVQAHLVATNPQEERELAHVLGELRRLGELELGGRAVGYRVVHELATARLAGLGTGRGQHLADGVVVSTSQPMRAIPFKAIFMVGLGEGEFPSVDRRDTLDLRAAKPQPGDVSPRERDRYLFLETLLCARQRLTLSYVARNPVSGEDLEPSSVVLELLEMAALGEDGRQARLREIPLRRHEGADPKRIRLPEAAREEAVAALRASLPRDGEGRLPALSGLRQAMEPKDWDALANRLALAAPPEMAAEHVERVRVSLAALRHFLECPLQGWAEYGLRLADDADFEDMQDREDEHLHTPRLLATQLLQRAFLDAPPGAASGVREVDAPYEAQLSHLQDAGRVPSGVFGEVEQARQRAVLHTWAELVHESGVGIAPLRVHRFGGAEEHEAVDALHPALVLPVEVRKDGVARTVEVELVGRAGPLSDSPWASVLLLDKKAPKSWQDEIARRGLRAYLEQLMLAAAGVHEGEHITVAIFGGEPSKFHIVPLAPISKKDARAQLAALLSDLLSGGHDYLMPCEAVFTAHRNAGSIGAEVEKLCEGYAPCSSSFGPIRDWQDRSPLPDEDANEIVQRRFGSYLKRLKLEGAG